jgi:hypothetical protein
MINRARWVLVGAAMMLLAVAFSWSCGGGGSSTPCPTVTTGVPVPCGFPSPPGATLQSISICPGSPPSPTPVSTSTAVASPTPIESTCPSPVVTAVPQGGTAQFHAVGVFSDGSHQDITNSATTNWTTNNSAVIMPNTSPPGSYFAAGPGCAAANATSGSISGTSAAVVDVPPIPSACPTPGPAAADLFGP